MKKNSFLTFVFALIPGAGHMYLGLMKKGISIMALFVAILGLIITFRFESMAVILPVIWFYSFFDTFNVRDLSEEEKRKADKFILVADNFLESGWNKILSKRHGLIGGILIVFGVFLLYDNFIRGYIDEMLYDIGFGEINWLNNLIYNFPTLFVAFLIIILGIYLIKGRGKVQKQKLLEQNEDLKEFKGDNHE